MNFDKSILKFALQNAVSFHGKANNGTVISKIIGENPDAKNNIKELAKEVNEAVAFVNKLSRDEQKYQLQNLAPELLEKKKKNSERELPPLPNAEAGKVLMRMAPYPSGPLHIGNARTFIINDEYVKRYDGKMLLVLDDTIGSEEKNISPDAYHLIPESLSWLGINFDQNILYKSDRLSIYYTYAEDLIEKGNAYVCFCAADILRENRANQTACECRKKIVRENKEGWKRMLDGTLQEGSAILRLKTDMQHPNPAFRDRVLFRISEREHPRVGTTCRVWPMLEFSWAIDDHLLGITHILRGKDLMIESDMEEFIWNIFGWKKAEFLYTGLVAIEGVKISKSKSKKEVMAGVYSGWDDPRTWSLQSLARRGILPGAIRNFCLEAGMSLSEVTVPVDSLYSENRKILDKDTKRYFFIEDPVKITVQNAPNRKVELKYHPEAEKGGRSFQTKNEFYIQKKDLDDINDEDLVRLMDCLNFTKKANSFVFDSVEVERYKERGKKIIHWLPAHEPNFEAEILMPDSSFKKGIVEQSIANAAEGEIMQLVRTGFCRLDKKEGNKAILWFGHN